MCAPIIAISEATSEYVDQLASPTGLQPGSLEAFDGEIADTQCALNVHSVSRSHREMIKAKQMGSDAASCARFCVRNMGGSFVLLNNRRAVYRLDDETTAETLAGRKVHVTGFLDRTGNIIHVTSITAAQ